MRIGHQWHRRAPACAFSTCTGHIRQLAAIESFCDSRNARYGAELLRSIHDRTAVGHRCHLAVDIDFHVRTPAVAVKKPPWRCAGHQSARGTLCSMWYANLVAKMFTEALDRHRGASLSVQMVRPMMFVVTLASSRGHRSAPAPPSITRCTHLCIANCAFATRRKHFAARFLIRRTTVAPEP